MHKARIGGWSPLPLFPFGNGQPTPQDVNLNVSPSLSHHHAMLAFPWSPSYGSMGTIGSISVGGCLHAALDRGLSRSCARWLVLVLMLLV